MITMHFHELSETEFQMYSETDFVCLININLWSFELARLAMWSDTSDNTEHFS